MIANKECDKNFKILLLGDCSVGKTCILLSYIEDTFTENHVSTIGVDYKIKIFDYQKTSELIKLQIWDTAGQDKFRAITKNYFRGSDGILLIYDTTCSKSFKNVRKWISQIKEALADEACIVLVGNKIDLEDKREVEKNEAQELSNEYNIKFIEVSAKNNKNIDVAFKALVDEMMDKYNFKIKSQEEKGRSKSQKLNKNSICSSEKDKECKKKKWC